MVKAPVKARRAQRRSPKRQATEAAAISTESSSFTNLPTKRNKMSRMERLSNANKRLKTAHDNHKRDYDSQIAKLDAREKSLKERLNELDKKKLRTARANGNEDSAGEDIVEVNAGGKVIVVKRSTLTQLKGTRLEALFSGRWSKNLKRDSSGRIFLDVNPVCFQAIVDHLSEIVISTEDNPPDPPSVDAEHDHILKHQLELFGLLDKVPTVEIPDSKIVKDEGRAIQLHAWLEEDGSDGEFCLLYRFSRDGESGQIFHSKCDNQGCTLTIIETTDGFIVGGYSNTPWASPNAYSSTGSYSAANKAFLFALLKSDSTSPCKMKLKNPGDNNAVYNSSTYNQSYSTCYGPTFGAGFDLSVQGSSVYLGVGESYESGPSGQLSMGNYYIIKEMEVFQVVTRAPSTTTQKHDSKTNLSKVNQVNKFSKELNDAINEKLVSLQEAEDELLELEDAFKDEGAFISFFASGSPQDVVSLNVCGTTMVTSRSTLTLCKGSALASKFLNAEDEAAKSSSSSMSVKEWNHDEVVAWLNQLEGIPGTVVKEFEDNQVTGRELLALGVEGLKDFGVTRKGTIYLLLDEIKKLKTASNNSVMLIEHSPYCFEKIIDHLRLEGPFMKGLVETKHRLPVVRSNEKGRYQKVLQHLFPGKSSKIFQDV